ncbi:hypothetical protein [Haloarchaeobius amylolyticus]|uniref:hypothetical protein n=1 Tax=Haloarchaeobius amylolyticus TaxID=1198296 RepID=UPI002270FE89|nr:hypothetical protein [Haloarchaeobius amylolyticus]
MSSRRSEFERIRAVLAEADADEPLSARQIVALLEEHGEDIESAHRVATILGRYAERGEVEVIRDQPYQYRLLDEQEPDPSD